MKPAGAKRAFSLLEVLVAIALFGIASAGMLMAVGPTYDALFRISNTASDAGDLELIKTVVESSADRATVLGGGEFALPSGDTAVWDVGIESTETEGLYLVRLHAARGDLAPLDYEYLHFEPGWRDPAEERPRWLQHSFGSGAGGGGGGAPAGGGRGQGEGRQGQGRGQEQGQAGRGQGRGQGQQDRGQGRGQGQGQGRGQGQGGRGQGQGQSRGGGAPAGGGARR